MQFSCLQENLSKGLAIVSRFVSSRPQLPVLANILLSAHQGKLKLGATNLESGIILQIGAKIEKEGEITIPAKTLTELIGSLPADKVELLLKENHLKINCQNFEASISGLSAAEFPPLPAASGKPSFSFKTEEISLPISQVAFAAAQDESRPVLSGVKIKNQEKNLVLAATDGFRLSVKKLPQSSSLPIDLILPARTLIEVARILGEEKEKEASLEVNKEQNQVIFSLANAEIVCRLLEGEFPNFEKIIPGSFASRAIIAKEEFLAAIRTASIFAREAANIIKFKIENGKFQISANAPQVGENITIIEAKTEGEGGEIAFNSRFLLDLLNIVPQEEIIFEMSGPLSPGVFKPLGDESFLHIIMPVRVQG
ncbi:DNA polymerase III subunit beta [Candidatus Gottesmanbacteria bacterium]|nr:DNA polymerase III subunit beta [Candidatus Gottesmanbacteria bacterium]